MMIKQASLRRSISGSKQHEGHFWEASTQSEHCSQIDRENERIKAKTAYGSYSKSDEHKKDQRGSEVIHVENGSGKVREVREERILLCVGM